ncbi:MAG: DNA mismatch repair endonuclease MutL [Bacteroidetes bacterium]|nr:DNA mismatch repair endonuclease MutL [Bacteroidota bacterium]MCH8523512.1 DNA mismatch repair endonuclease MutL [Balneolales bacterium]
MTNESLSESTEGIIRLLPSDLANKIAAGEVVQRPSSVIKELLDNSIDAGATQITVHLQQAGRTLIQVDDNGCGMSKSDIPNCFLRHATSKITSVDDLYAIRTLGFRGEAMASIASVAQITLKTKRIEDESGFLYEVWGGEERTFEPAAVANGTSIAVKNLFYNVPARRAFLKTDNTEFRHAIIVFQQMALTNPSISFALQANGETVYNLPTQSLEERIAEIFGKSYKASLIPVDETAGFVRIHGFLADPKLTKKNRGEQFLFVNGRPIMHRHLTHVVLEQYKNWISDSEYPFFAIFYEVDPTQVDVNVHPSKMEIKFEDERTVSMLTKSVVKRALNERYSVPDMRFPADDDYYEPFPIMGRNEMGSEGQSVQRFPSRINFQQSSDGAVGKELEIKTKFGNNPTYGSYSMDLYRPGSGSHAPDLTGSTSRPERERAVGFWQLHQSFLVTQTLAGMCIVDQHLAHKRIIYERALNSIESGIPSTQQLLFPQSLQLSASDYAELKNVLPDLLRMGFDISLLSGFTAIINGVPADIQLGDERSLIESIIQQYQNISSTLKLESRQKLALALASKTAMPRGKKLSQTEMETLFDQLFSCEQPYIDPLNKPTISYLSLDEIRSRFR